MASVKAVRHAMDTTLGDDADEVQKVLGQNGIARNLAKEAVVSAQENGRFTVFAMVDALTRIAGEWSTPANGSPWTRRPVNC